jgi:hypothetical protein
MWKNIRNRSGQIWQINLEGLRQLSFAYCRMQLAFENTTHKSKVYDPGGVTSILDDLFGAPVVLSSMETDWDAVDKSLHARVTNFQCHNSRLWADRIAPETIDYLADIRRKTINMNRAYGDSIQRTNSYNAAQFARLDDSLDNAMRNAKLVRDSCMTSFLAVSGFLTGGAALVAIAGGSIVQGGFTYQDTRSVGAAVVSLAGTFLTNIVPMAKAGPVGNSLGKIFGKSSQAFLVTYQVVGSAATEAATSYLSGDAAVQTADGTAARTVFSSSDVGLGKLMDAGLRNVLKTELGKKAFPVEVTLELILNNVADRTVAGIEADSGPISTLLPRPSMKGEVFAIHDTASADDITFIRRNVLRRLR